MANELTTVGQLKTMLSNDMVKKRFEEILGSKAAGFISTVIQVSSNNALLAKADPKSILNAAVVAATVDLSINPNLQQAAIVPYGNSAQFQIMTNGLTELSMRSGQFKSIVNEVVHEGELVKKNKFTGEYVFDEDAKTSDKVIGFMASFTLVNGFQKTLYITVDEANEHGKKYSKTYQRGSGLWATDFEAMGKKTVLKKLLSKFAPKSIEMQKAIQFDQSSVKGDASSPDELVPEYLDNETYAEEIDFEANFENVKNDIEAAKIAFAKGEITEEQFNSVKK